jgi:hypothetical protein
MVHTRIPCCARSRAMGSVMPDHTGFGGAVSLLAHLAIKGGD